MQTFLEGKQVIKDSKQPYQNDKSTLLKIRVK
jgi:hypothetical protein